MTDPKLPKPIQDLVENAEGTQQRFQAAKLQRLKLLLSGEAKPSNEFCAYCVKQLQQYMDEAQSKQSALQQHRKAVQQLEQELLEIQGAANKALKDVQAWDRPLTQPVPEGDDTESTKGD